MIYIFHQIKMWLDVHLIGCIKRNLNKKYEGANPSRDNTDKAMEILRMKKSGYGG